MDNVKVSKTPMRTHISDMSHKRNTHTVCTWQEKIMYCLWERFLFCGVSSLLFWKLYNKEQNTMTQLLMQDFTESCWTATRWQQHTGFGLIHMLSYRIVNSCCKSLAQTCYSVEVQILYQ